MVQKLLVGDELNIQYISYKQDLTIRTVEVYFIPQNVYYIVRYKITSLESTKNRKISNVLNISKTVIVRKIKFRIRNKTDKHSLFNRPYSFHSIQYAMENI